MSEDRREFVLAALRVGSLRCKAMGSEIDSIGVALKGGLIDEYTAMQWVREIGAIDLVRHIPYKDEVYPFLEADVKNDVDNDFGSE